MIGSGHIINILQITIKGGTVMRIYTVQKKRVWEILLRGFPVICNPSYSMAYTECSAMFKEAYGFMANAMKKTLNEPSLFALYPMWGWANLEKWKVLGFQYGKKGDDMCLLTLDIPDSDVLLSDFVAWDCVLQGNYVPQYKEPFLRIMEQRFLPVLPESDRERIIRDSWERIFTVDFHENAVQATFWEIKPEYVTDVEFFKEQHDYKDNRGHNRGH